jgi:hypothetical protein
MDATVRIDVFGEFRVWHGSTFTPEAAIVRTIEVFITTDEVQFGRTRRGRRPVTKDVSHAA